MLEFDAAEQSYVWLVTSILRDSRLERVPYQGCPTTNEHPMVRLAGGVTTAPAHAAPPIRDVR
jgi:hypothetical protein